MEKVDNYLKQLEYQINSCRIDFEILQKLKQTIESFSLGGRTFEQFIKILIQIYQLSNNENLYTIRRNSIAISEMAVELKILACKMISMTIEYFYKEQTQNELPIEILNEAIQIMIICTRVCLNQSSNKYTSTIQQYYKFIHSGYELVSNTMDKSYRFLHHLNVLQLMRYRCDNQTFSIIEFQKRLQKITSYEQIQNLDNKLFVQNIIMEIILKSLKNGRIKPENIKNFYSYLSQQNQKDLNFLVFDLITATKNIENFSQFLQIYKQIKQYGLESINIEFLKDFIQKDTNFKDQRIFQIAALTLQPKILDIWFNIFVNKKQKPPLIQKALSCYMHIIDSTMSDQNYFDLKQILKLSNNVAYALLTEKKASSTTHPTLSIIKCLVKVLIAIIFKLYDDWNNIKDFGERIILLCSRYQCMEVSKVIYSVLLYYCLIKKIKAQQIYDKFEAYHAQQKSSEIYKLLSSVYNIQNSRNENNSSNLSQNSIQEYMKIYPFVSILFSQQNQDMAIFQIQPKQFKKINKKFFIYAQMLKKYYKNHLNLQKILNHLEQFLIKIKIEEFQHDLHNSQPQNIEIQRLQAILIDLIDEKQIINRKQNQKITLDLQNKNELEQRNSSKINFQKDFLSQIWFILVNLHILENKELAEELKQTGFGILLNKYSMKTKMLSGLIELIKKNKTVLKSEFYQICCCYLTSVLQKFKVHYIKKQRIGDPGEISFVNCISELIETTHIEQEEKVNQGQGTKFNSDYKIVKNKAKKEFMFFTIFQIDCITNNVEKYEKIIDQIPLFLLKNLTHSQYITKSLKQKFFRRLVKQNFTESKCDISLSQFKQIIEATDDPQQLKLYIQFVFACFGNEGKNIIMLLANQNKKIQQILLEDDDLET